MVRRAAARAGAIARRNVRAAAERDGEVDRHDEMSAGFIGHLHGLLRSAVRMNPGIVSADRHDRQIDGTGNAQLRKQIAQRGVAAENDATVISLENVAVVTAIGIRAPQCFTRNATMSILPAEVDTDFLSFQRSSLASRNRVQRSRSLVRWAVITLVER